MRAIRGAVNPRHTRLQEEPKTYEADTTPRERFVTLIESRTEKLHAAFNLVRKLSDKEYYPHTEEDRERLRRFLEVEYDLTVKSFEAGHEVSGGLRLSRD
jgi:hypothetical protein